MTQENLFFSPLTQTHYLLPKEQGLLFFRKEIALLAKINPFSGTCTHRTPRFPLFLIGIAKLPVYGNCFHSSLFLLKRRLLKKLPYEVLNPPLISDLSSSGCASGQASSETG